jgi:hypothetical protein
MQSYLYGMELTSMEEPMFSISKLLHAGRTFVRGVVGWGREIRSRNGTADARRAQARRLLMQQSCAGLPGGYPYGELSSPHRTRLHPGGLEP